MAAKKKMSAQEQWDQAVKSGAIRPLKQPVQESVSSKGATTPAKGVKTTNVSRARGTGSESRLGSAVLKGAELIARGTLAVSGVDAAGNATKSAVKNPNPVNIARAVGTTALSVGAGPIAKATSRNTYLFGRTVVHGSPQSGLKQVNPVSGSRVLPNEKVAWVWDAKKVRSEAGGLDYATQRAHDYATKSGGTGSIYVGKVPKSALRVPQEIVDVTKRPGQRFNFTGAAVSNKPVKGLKEIRTPAGKTVSPATVEQTRKAIVRSNPTNALGEFSYAKSNFKRQAALAATKVKKEVKLAVTPPSKKVPRSLRGKIDL